MTNCKQEGPFDIHLHMYEDFQVNLSDFQHHQSMHTHEHLTNLILTVPINTSQGLQRTIYVEFTNCLPGIPSDLYLRMHEHVITNH